VEVVFGALVVDGVPVIVVGVAVVVVVFGALVVPVLLVGEAVVVEVVFGALVVDGASVGAKVGTAVVVEVVLGAPVVVVFMVVLGKAVDGAIEVEGAPDGPLVEFPVVVVFGAAVEGMAEVEGAPVGELVLGAMEGIEVRVELDPVVVLVPLPEGGAVAGASTSTLTEAHSPPSRGTNSPEKFAGFEPFNVEMK